MKPPQVSQRTGCMARRSLGMRSVPYSGSRSFVTGVGGRLLSRGVGMAMGLVLRWEILPSARTP
jgi:hypothetical protein